jgi:hypothetical protein
VYPELVPSGYWALRILSSDLASFWRSFWRHALSLGPCWQVCQHNVEGMTRTPLDIELWDMLVRGACCKDSPRHLLSLAWHSVLLALMLAGPWMCCMASVVTASWKFIACLQWEWADKYAAMVVGKRKHASHQLTLSLSPLPSCVLLLRSSGRPIVPNL